MVFRKLKEELMSVNSGTVFVHIRNNEIGKFGIKHLPFEGTDSAPTAGEILGLTETQFQSFRQMALASLKRKKSWTHGEILFDFAVRKNMISISVLFESNYNMASYANTI
ncbi:O-methyltransferase [Paenibacillus roseipurpureus]|uniref:O-methyltransferase n=1 Tax=Paenibacillus roseopurpureus TaxID=2918901 RepID=A0AA96LQR0_9BACL|nr:O-methyltransferase [Paenibacillus sp. MBLB1832]WNR45586.1 O-methyltransferase [Paenibacillus sp. MBLB1832]